MSYILLFILIILFITYYPQKFKPIQLDQLNLNNTTSLFWTGGFDSTFRLCQLLINEKKKVQPIYIACKNVDTAGKGGRRSKLNELQAMKVIRQQLAINFPYTKSLLYPVLYVKHIRPNKDIDRKSRYIHYTLGKYSRPYTQYERMARFSSYYPNTIEVGLENCGTGLDNATKGNRIGYGPNCRINDNLIPKYKALEIYKKFRFPIVHLTKKQMVTVAKKNGYYNILKNTWSCWFPKNGKPCGKCEMCKKRIIKNSL